MGESIKYTTEFFIERAQKKFGNFIDYSLVNYQGINNKIILICPIHKKFVTTPFKHLHNKHSCPKCSNKTLTFKNFIKKSKEKFKKRFSYISIEENFYNSIPINIICKKHGIFLVKPWEHLRLQSGGCRDCASNKKLNIQDFINKSKKIHNDKYDYSLIEYKNNLTNIKLICPIHGLFKQTPSNHLKYGCSQCAGTNRKTTAQFIEKANIIHSNKYNYDLVTYVNAHTKIEIICGQHGSFWQTPSNHIHNGGRGCPQCIQRISKNEKKWLDFLNVPNDKFHRNVYIKTSNHKYWVDGYIPETNTVYEFNGDYWHGNLKIYNANDIHPEIKISFKKINDRTINKQNDLINHGFNVVSIWETDFLNQNIYGK